MSPAATLTVPRCKPIVELPLYIDFQANSTYSSVDSASEPPRPTRITPTDLTQFKRWLVEQRRLKPNTVNRKLATLKSFLTWVTRGNTSARSDTAAPTGEVPSFPTRKIVLIRQACSAGPLRWEAKASRVRWPLEFSRSCKKPHLPRLFCKYPVIFCKLLTAAAQEGPPTADGSRAFALAGRPTDHISILLPLRSRPDGCCRQSPDLIRRDDVQSSEHASRH
jgi:hypothetical protein